MNIDISDFFDTADFWLYSHSAAEGGPTSGKDTWSAAMAEAEHTPLLSTPEEVEAFKAYLTGLGAWDRDEIDGWSDQRCNAGFIQLVSGDIRAADLDTEPSTEDWLNHMERDDGVGGNIYSVADRVYYSLD